MDKNVLFLKNSRHHVPSGYKRSRLAVSPLPKSPMQSGDYLWIVILGGIFAFLDAYGIGANDVANSFATSVGSRSLTLWQACSIAIFTEFGGAVLLGAETAETIRSGIINLSLFKGTPEILMLAYMCALVGSSFWVITASKYGAPVSTTHSIVGAMMGVGIARFGWAGIEWAPFSKILISWITSPGIAGVVGALIFLSTKYTVLNHENSLQRGLTAIPFYFMFTLSLLTFYVVLKAPKGIDLTKAANQTPKNFAMAFGISLGLGVVVVGIFCYGFLVPYFRRLLVEEEDLKWYHVFYTPFVPKQSKNMNLHNMIAHGAQDTTEKTDAATVAEAPEQELKNFGDSSMLVMARNSGKKAYSYLTRGLFMDVASVQSEKHKEMHEAAVHYDDKTEYLYSFLQVCTAAFASFAHGSNDVANAAGPFSGIINIYNSGAVPGSKVAPII
jgi:sodium-dependent phosphate transporter